MSDFAVCTDFIDPGAPLTKINAATLEGYHTELLDLIKKKKITGSTGRDRIDTAKQFVKWLWERELIELPRNLQKLKIRKAVKAVEIIPDAEVKRLLGSARGATELYLLLALNCGFTQTDIAKLRQDEVNWTAGRIKRKRSKTADHEDVPTANYLLWRETAKLVRRYRSKDKKLVLLNADGKPLLDEGTNEHGKYHKNDNIRSCYSRLLKRIGGLYPFKLFRKTAPSKLGEHAEYARFAQYFLGHSPGTVADRHYVKPSEEQFDAAIKWLGQQFGIE